MPLLTKNPFLQMINILLILSFTFFLNCKEKSTNAPSSLEKSSSVKVKISWDYKSIPLEIQIYEPPIQKPFELWQTGSVKTKEELPASIPITDSQFFISPGSKKSFVLVAHNSSNSPLYFFAAPHHVSPEEYSLGFKFKCLCVNHAFQVGPGEYWYRVVELRMGKNYSGSEIDIKHAIIGIDEERMKDYGKEESSHSDHDI